MTHEILKTEDLSLAAALLTMGCKCTEKAVKLTINGKHQYCFFFGPTTADGKYTTKQLILAYNDPEYSADNPDCPFAHIIEAFNARKKLLSEVKNNDITHIHTVNDGHGTVATWTGKTPAAIERLANNKR